jgi:hypothetical protein
VRFRSASLGETGVEPDDEVMVEIPSATRAVYMQVTFIDGTASGIDYFAFFTFSDTALAPFFSASVKAASNDGPD